MKKAEMEKYITDIPDFPKKGVVFKDFSPLLEQKLPETVDGHGKGLDWDICRLRCGH